MAIIFRKLTADEIECRVGQKSKDNKRFSVLLFKTARVDQSFLDEVVGRENWQSEHYEVKGKDFCKIGIRIERGDKSEWVWKSDCGSESNIEAEKGEASDAFKRAGFQWGIGRELYTAPKIWITSEVDPYTLSVSKIGYDENDRISELEIMGKRNGQWEVVYPTIKEQEKQTQEKKQTYRVVSKEDRKNELIGRLYDMGGDVQKVLAYYKVSDLEDLSEELLDKIVKSWERRIQSESQQG